MNRLSTEELYEQYCNNKTHSQCVKQISMLLFDEINAKLRVLPINDRKMLESAALLHDIGYSISEKGHNKYSQKLILEYGLRDFSKEETEIISCIARYHRGSIPDKNEHEIYNTLDKNERKTIKYLGGILKLADGLENRQIGKIQSISLNYNESEQLTELQIKRLESAKTPDISGILHKKDLFEIAYKTQLVLRFV